MEGGKEVKCYCLEGDFFLLFSVSWHPLDSASDPVGLKQSLRILPTLILPAYRSTLTACVFVDRDTVRHPRRFVFGKFVRKPNCSWSEAFVNRGLTVQPLSIYTVKRLAEFYTYHYEQDFGTKAERQSSQHHTQKYQATASDGNFTVLAEGPTTELQLIASVGN